MHCVGCDKLRGGLQKDKADGCVDLLHIPVLCSLSGSINIGWLHDDR